MKNDRDEQELQELEAEFGELFAATGQEPTPRQIAAMRQRAESMGTGRDIRNWWHSLRWMGAGAAVTAAALLALALFQQPPEPTGEFVASNDVRAGDIRSVAPDTLAQLAGFLAVEESLADDFWFAEENEWATATSLDLFYGPMPGDDLGEWDGLYDHLLAQNMAEELLF